MEVADAETVFNFLGKRYEDAYADSPNLKSVMQDALTRIRPGSRVLDVGCGTGEPVASMLAAAGHSVYGIDVAEEMIKIARLQVPGRFEKADMRTYTPPHKFGAVFVIYSLFQISPSETHGVVYRFAEWLEDDGVMILGVMPSTSLESSQVKSGELLRDKTWDCVRWMKKPWMTRVTNETFLSEQGWQDLLQSAGFTVEEESLFEFTPKDKEHTTPEHHYLIVARKNARCHPLLGPYPFPESHLSPQIRHSSAWKELQSRFTFDDGQNIVLDVLKRSATILDVGQGLGFAGLEIAPGIIAAKTTKIFLDPSGNLPFGGQSFDAVIAISTLEYANDVEKSVRELARVTNAANPLACIMIFQAAPESEAQRLLSSNCAPLSTQNKTRHQGHLLHSAGKVLSETGFAQISMQRVNGHFKFSDSQLPRQCHQAAEALASLQYREDPNYAQMKEALIPQLQLLFQDHPNIIRHELAVLIARPLAN
ncbi:hypothetical protein AJ80_03293 [Polytolypa hystricis UAMH7299]|uniref:Methyltransferase domain-containing protein n=1 Tax=Polytolypa hystricis (strain UAMH7299) TaxID=1447883 RepID=A0A2B7YIJ7_POLH7|nr:hypothetical protein AJ80_03293 [Polytolypa hystricis UAMH7299]